MIGVDGTLSMSVQNQNTHRTPLKPHDQVNIKASVSSADGPNMVAAYQSGCDGDRAWGCRLVAIALSKYRWHKFQ